MAKLTGKKKAEFLKRMARGRKKAARGNPKKKTAKKASPRKKTGAKKGKLTGAKKAEFLKRMARGRKKAARGNPKKKARKKTRPKKKTQAQAGYEAIQAYKKKLQERTKGNPRRKNRRRNQEGMEGAERMFETFHQKAPGRIIDYEEFVQYPDKFAELGKLKELRFHLNKANPDHPLTNFGGDCLAVTTPDGQNIYFVGGDQNVDLEALGITSGKDFVELGPCTYIRYHTVKGFHDFEPTNYFHHFGEEDRILPTLNYDRLSRALFLASGNYRVERPGIVN